VENEIQIPGDQGWRFEGPLHQNTKGKLPAFSSENMLHFMVFTNTNRGKNICQTNGSLARAKECVGLLQRWNYTPLFMIIHCHSVHHTSPLSEAHGNDLSASFEGTVGALISAIFPGTQ
jgi:hypothetical protein